MKYVHCKFFLLYIGHSLIYPSPPISPESIADIFCEPITIADAYTSLNTELGYVLKTAEVPMLKASLYSQTHTPSGVTLDEPLQADIEAANSGEDLIVALGKSTSCNWLDIRLLNTLARATRSPIALNLIKAYETLLYSKSLKEALPKFSLPRFKKKSYLTEVSMKLDVPEDKITIGDVVKYQWEIEEVILDLGKGILKLEHVKEGCLEIYCAIPVKFTFGAYKMALHNRHKTHLLRVMHIKLGNLPLIIDPLGALSPTVSPNYSGEWLNKTVYCMHVLQIIRSTVSYWVIENFFECNKKQACNTFPKERVT